MTLQNALVHRDRVYLWTDEGYFDAQSGDLLFLAPKAVKCQWPPFAVSTSSTGGDPQAILAAIAEAAPVDLPSLLSAISSALRAHADKEHIASALIAYCEDEPRLFFASTVEAHGEPPFEPFEILHWLCTGNTLPAYAEAVALGFTPERMGAVIDGQLAAPCAGEGAMAAHGERLWFGGGVVQIEVSRSGVKERVIRMVER